MAAILLIDTALDVATAAIGSGGKIIAARSNENQRDHAAFLHMAIREMLDECGIKPSDLGAVAVANGPGSYTGLRVGLSAAKGLCYALGIPLLTISTLEILANSATAEGRFYVPMVDARRMEVFSQIFDAGRQSVTEAGAEIIEPGSYQALLEKGIVVFCGNGAAKMASVSGHPNMFIDETGISTGIFLKLAEHEMARENFADLKNAEPNYVKNFQKV